MKKLFVLAFVPASLWLNGPVMAAKLPSVSPDSVVVEKPSSAAIQDAIKAFSSLPKAEKRARIKAMKQVVREYRAAKKAGNEVDSTTVIQVIIALFIPPLAVYLHQGETDNKFWITVLLTVLGLLLFGFAGVLFLGTLPSIIYALLVILKD